MSGRHLPANYFHVPVSAHEEEGLLECLAQHWQGPNVHLQPVSASFAVCCSKANPKQCKDGQRVYGTVDLPLPTTDDPRP